MHAVANDTAVADPAVLPDLRAAADAGQAHDHGVVSHLHAVGNLHQHIDLAPITYDGVIPGIERLVHAGVGVQLHLLAQDHTAAVIHGEKLPVFLFILKIAEADLHPCMNHTVVADGHIVTNDGKLLHRYIVADDHILPGDHRQRADGTVFPDFRSEVRSGISPMPGQRIVQPEKHDSRLRGDTYTPPLCQQLGRKVRRCNDHHSVVADGIQRLFILHKGAKRLLNGRDHQPQRGKFLFIFQLEIILRQQLRQQYAQLHKIDLISFCA